MTRSTKARGWILGVAQLVAWGALAFAPAIVAGDVARDLAVERREVFGWLGASLVVSSFSGDLVGRALRRWGGRAVLVAGTLIGALGLVVLSCASGRVGLLVGTLLLGAASATCLYDALFAAEAGAADHRRLVGIVPLAGGLASTVSWPLTHALDETLGWRTAVLVLALGLVAIAVPSYVVAASPGPARAPLASGHGAWPVAVALASGGFVAAALGAHLVPTLSERVVDDETAVALGMLVGPAQVAGRLLDVVGRRSVSPSTLGTLALLAIAGGTALLALTDDLLGLGLAIVGFGAGSGLLTVARGAVAAELGGPAVLGAFTLSGQLARAIAPPLFALGDTRVGLLVSSALALSGALALGVGVGGHVPRRRSEP